jgi:DNA recombination protein Rad52
MTFTPEQKAELTKPLDPKHVRKPSGRFGPKGDYIEGWHAIAEANRIFGHDGWSYAIELRQDALAEGKDSNGAPQWQAAYTCICTVEAGGVHRQDVGFGSGFAKQAGDAIEGATKEAATDALKRCLRTFGHPFGLALYDKTREHVGVSVDLISDADHAEITTLAGSAGVSLVEVCKRAGVENLNQLPASAVPAIKKKLNLTIDQKLAARESEPAK